MDSPMTVVVACLVALGVGWLAGYAYALAMGDKDWAAMHRDLWRLKEDFDRLEGNFDSLEKRFGELS